MKMNCELVAVGTEILLGNIVNTHARFLSEQLAAIGVPVYYHTTAGDNPVRLRLAAEEAFARSDLVIFAGGLGPTEDDITAKTVCDLLGLDMTFNGTAWERIQTYYRKKGRTPDGHAKKQCMLPKEAKVFYNDYGTAPGFAAEKGGKTAVLLPGPPRELIPMVKEQLIPWLQEKSGLNFHSETLMVYGIGEPKLEDLLSDLVQGTNPTVALYAKDGQVQVRVTDAIDRAQPDYSRMEQTIAEIRRRTGLFCYGRNVDTPEQVVVSMLKERGLTIAAAESLTGGMIGESITAVPGSSAVLECGIISYSDRIKHEVLGVEKELLDTQGAVSAPVAIQMARGIKRISGADIALSVTGFAGPAGEQDNHPVGTVFLSVIYQNRQLVKELHLGHGSGGERNYIRRLTVMEAMDVVRRALLSDPQLIWEEI